jgi:TolB protein
MTRPALPLPALVLLLSTTASAQSTPPPESVLGTVEVDGSAGPVALPKMGLVPLDEGKDVQELVGKDLDRIGLYDVVSEPAKLPEGPFAEGGPLDVKPWKAKGWPYVVRVRETKDPKPALVGEVWIVAKGDTPVATKTVDLGSDRRRASHELADALLNALTGRTGPFASRLAYVKRVGKGRQVFLAESDGHAPVAYGSAEDTALAPTFGPDGDVFYTVSKAYEPFRLVRGKEGKPVPLNVKGSVLSVAFSPDRSKLAVATMSEETGKLFVGKADGSELSAIAEGMKLPNRPAFGPLDKLAFVANKGTQRVFVGNAGGGEAISPAGFHASAPVFCDTPQGLLVVFTVGVGSGADLVATDTAGGGLRRLTQGHGSNAYPACSPDGRLVAFFSTGAAGKAPGMYVLPISNPTRIRKLSDEHGESLAWAR